MKRYYMHTIQEQPAYFDGEMICYARTGRYGHQRQLLVPSLKQLKQEQEACRRYRICNGLSFDKREYGYCIVGVPL